MRVVIDARTVYSGSRRGTGKNLIDLYRRVARLQPDWRFVMLHRGVAAGQASDPFAAEPNVSAVAVDIRGDRWNFWEQIRLPLAAAACRASALHSPANTAPYVSSVPLVLTVHDLIPLEREPLDPPARRWETNVRRGVARARRVITPSEFTKHHLVDRFHVDADKIVVNHWGPDGAIRRIDERAEIDRVRVAYGLAAGQAYLFGFGATDPRKNTLRIVEAWAGLDAGLRERVALLLVGLAEPMLTKARTLAMRLAPTGGWSLMPFADERDIPALMSGATALCYPSLSEGFGLPVLDAFACGVPVITSRTTSLPEVTGDAALLVDPLDVGDIRHAIERVTSDEWLRRALVERGTARLGAFSWDRCARTVADVLAAAAG